MAIVADIFNQNAWGAVEFDENIVQRVDFKPHLLGGLNLFEPINSRSQSIAIANRDQTLALIPTSAMGEAPAELIPQGAKVRDFRAVRLAKGSTVFAHELAGMLALPFDQQTKSVTDEVTTRTGQIMDDLELTWEHMRLGAVLGQVVDADGSSILWDWYDEWGIAQPAEVDFALDDATTDVRKKCRDLKRAAQKAAKGVWTPSTRLGSLVGDEFFDLLVNHPQYKETKLGTAQASSLEGIEGYSVVDFEGISFINYRGTDDGSTLSIDSAKARFFPIGARGAFKVGWAPASEFKAYLGQAGKDYVGLLLSDPSGRDQWDRVELYSYPLYVCTRPEMLLRAKAA
jgi:hypothetical protein